MSAYRIRVAKSDEDFAELQALDEKFFPGVPEEAANWRNGRWWLLKHDGKVVGYAGARILPAPDVATLYMCRAAVAREHRGHGLQKRLIRVRLNWGRTQECKTAITYTMRNPASANSLIACGFRVYAPETPWVEGDGITFWRYEFGKRRRARV